MWSLAKAYSHKCPALVATTFDNPQGGRLQEHWLYFVFDDYHTLEQIIESSTWKLEYESWHGQALKDARTSFIFK